LATKDHFSSNWTSRVFGGKSHEFLVQIVGVLAGDSAQAADGVAIHLAEPAGLTHSAPFGDMLEDRFDLRRREPGVEEGRPLAFREAGLAGGAAEHASGLLRPVATGHGQISGPALAMLGAFGIQAAETGEVVHGAALLVQSSVLTAGYVTPL
jgi:hypothetical protein